MWLWADAAVPELATSATAPAAVARARRVAFIGRDSRKPSWMAATADVRTGSGKSRRGDSNPRPTTYEAVALPLSYSGGRGPGYIGSSAPPGSACEHHRDRRGGIPDDTAAEPSRCAHDRHHRPRHRPDLTCDGRHRPFADRVARRGL